jgi:hypothetical protein
MPKVQSQCCTSPQRAHVPSQDKFAKTWAIGVGIDIVVQFKNAFTSVVQSVLVYVVVGSAFGPAKWLGMWLDTASIQAREHSGRLPSPSLRHASPACLEDESLEDQ